MIDYSASKRRQPKDVSLVAVRFGRSTRSLQRPMFRPRTATPSRSFHRSGQSPQRARGLTTRRILRRRHAGEGIFGPLGHNSDRSRGALHAIPPRLAAARSVPDGLTSQKEIRRPTGFTVAHRATGGPNAKVRTWPPLAGKSGRFDFWRNLSMEKLYSS